MAQILTICMSSVPVFKNRNRTEIRFPHIPNVGIVRTGYHTANSSLALKKYYHNVKISTNNKRIVIGIVIIIIIIIIIIIKYFKRTTH